MTQTPPTSPTASPNAHRSAARSSPVWAGFLVAATVLLLLVALLFVGLSGYLRKARQLEVARVEIEQRADEVTKLRQDLSLQAKREKEATTEINKLTTNLSGEREARTRDAKELTDLRAQRANLDRLKAEREKAAEDLRLATADRDELRRQAAEIVVVKSKLEEQVSVLTLRLDEAMGKIRDLETRVAALTNERDTLREQLRSAQDRVAIAEARLAAGVGIATAGVSSGNGFASSNRMDTLAGGRWSGLAGRGGPSGGQASARVGAGAASSGPGSPSMGDPSRQEPSRLGGLFRPSASNGTTSGGSRSSSDSSSSSSVTDAPFGGVRLIDDSMAPGRTPSPADDRPAVNPGGVNAGSNDPPGATNLRSSQNPEAGRISALAGVLPFDDSELRSASGTSELMNDLPPGVRVAPGSSFGEPVVRGRTLTPFRPGGLSETNELMDQAAAMRRSLMEKLAQAHAAAQAALQAGTLRQADQVRGVADR